MAKANTNTRTNAANQETNQETSHDAVQDVSKGDNPESSQDESHEASKIDKHDDETQLYIILRSSVPVRFRAGIRITSEGTRIARNELSDEQIETLANDPLISIRAESEE